MIKILNYISRDMYGGIQYIYFNRFNNTIKYDTVNHFPIENIQSINSSLHRSGLDIHMRFYCVGKSHDYLVFKKILI